MEKAKQFFSGFKKGAEHFGNNISLIINCILLTLVYVIGVGLTFIIAKMVGKHFLETKMTRGGTYWVDLNLKRKKDIKEYYRQF